MKYIVTTHGSASQLELIHVLSFKIVIATSIEVAIAIEKQLQVLAAVWARQVEVRAIAQTY